MDKLEKWYVWDGNGQVPSNHNRVKKVIFKSNMVVDDSYGISIINCYVDNWLDNVGEETVKAYTLGEQVESKRGEK